jgi:hypothetical protein
MKRVVVTAIVLLYLLTLPATVSAAPDNATANGTANNTTAENLQERLQQKNQTIQNLRNKNSNLKTQVTSLESQVQDLEYQLNNAGNGGSFPSWMAAEMNETGAWNPYSNKPAYFIIRNNEIWYYVGEGNGQHNPNGMNAWKPWITFEEAGDYKVTAPYSPDNVNGTLTFQTGFQATGAKAAIRTKVNALNSPQTFAAYQQWNNEQRHNAETTGRNTWLGIFSLFLLGLYGSAWIESKHNFLQDRQERREIARRMGFVGVRSKSNWKGRVLGALLKPPIIGHITAGLLRGYQSVSSDRGDRRR